MKNSIAKKFRILKNSGSTSEELLSAIKLLMVSFTVLLAFVFLVMMVFVTLNFG